MPSLYLLLRPLNAFSSAAESTLAFTALDFSGTNIFVNGQLLYLQDIKCLIEKIVENAKVQLKRLLFNIDLVDVDTWDPGLVYEEPRNRRVGHSCFSDPRNLLQHKETLLEAILTHPDLKGLFHFVDPSSHIAWKAGPCLAYIDDCHKLEMLLFCGTHLSYGEPARGSELASHLINNVTGGSLRNVFVMFQLLCLMGTYGKTGHLMERDIVIMRVPLPEIGRLWLLYLSLVRPVTVVWQQHFRGDKAALRARDRLFLGPNKLVQSDELSDALATLTLKELGIKINISLWRHIVTWFLNHHSVRLESLLSHSDKAALAAQMGHGERTHALYAGDERLPHSIDFHVCYATIRMSASWQRLLGFETTRFSGIPGGLSAVVPHHTNGECSAEARPLLTQVTEIVEQVKASIIPELVRMLSHTRANDLASLLTTFGVDPQKQAGEPGNEDATRVVPHPSRLRDLRRFLCNDEAFFKTPQQAEAVEIIASKPASLLLIGPTGKHFRLTSQGTKIPK
jgi:hypothetical protein